MSYRSSPDGVTVDLSNTGAQVISASQGTDTIVNVEGVIGSDSADTITGSTGADFIEGAGGDDILQGGLGNDTYLWGEGEGLDTITDSGGTADAIVFQTAPFDVLTPDILDAFRSGDNLEIRTDAPSPEGMTIVGQFTTGTIEGFQFDDLGGALLTFTATPTAGNDFIVLAGAADTVSGGDGIDAIYGNAGADILSGGNDSDFLIGGAGADQLSGDAGDDVLVDGAFANADADTLDGGAGNDLLVSRGGNDTLIGGDGDDVYEIDLIAGGAVTITDTGGADTLVVVEGDDDDIRLTNLVRSGDDLIATFDTGSIITVIDHFAGGRIEFAKSDDDDEGDDFVVLNADPDFTTSFGDIVAGTSLSDTIFGLAGDDTIFGNEGSDTLDGGSGDDDLTGGADDDELSGGAGADTLDGGAGFDGVDYSLDAFFGGTGGVTVNLATGTATDEFGDTDTLISIEAVRGTEFADTLTGGDGFESFIGGAGNDTIDGGSGGGQIEYSDDAESGGTAGVTVNFATGTATDGFGDTDTITNIELVRGTNFADTLTGGNPLNDGFEIFEGLGGDDAIDGGSGFDEVGYSFDADFGGTAGVTVNLATGTATDGFGDTDTLTSIESVSGTEFADTLTGDGGNNSLFGGRGDDTIDGAAGNDFIDGGAGDDTIVFDAADTSGVDGGTGTDILSVAGSGVTIDLTAIADGVFEGFERIDLTGAGDNTLVMTVTDLVAITDGVNALTGTANTLIVDGNAGDAVDAGSGWVLIDAAVDIGGQIFTSYTQDTATILVDNDVDQSAFFGIVPVDLGDVACGTGGFKVTGETTGDLAGSSIASAGDFNGDGFIDVIVGAPAEDTANTDAGAAYVVFGAASGITAVNLDDIAAGTGGFKMIGEAGPIFENAGTSVESAGDVNGDGIDDLIVGARANDAGGPNAGAAYIVFGTATPPTSIDLANVANGTGGFKITGENAYDRAGGGERQSVATAGDVNGDGFDDVIVAAYLNDAGVGDEGAAYVVFGAASGITAVNLDAGALGTGGFKMTGENADDLAGISVSSAGDVNGDGFDDVIVGAQDNDEGLSNAGAAYVVFGAASGITAVDLVDIANGTGGFKIIGEAADDRAGRSVSAAGDVNGDGFDDVIVGAFGNDAGETNAGAAYVVFGAASGITSVNLDAIALGTGGFKITGENADDLAGISVSSAGDVNGDRFDDVIVGALAGTSAGAAYIVFGAASGITSVNLDDVAAGIGGFKINGEVAGDQAGVPVSSAGDIDGDGFDDVIVGSRFNDAGGDPNAGAAYVVFGADFTNQVDFLGTDGNDMLTGTGANEILIGGQGDDTIDGAGGDDVIIGGSGNDTIIYDSATDTLKVDAGTGTDILSVEGSGVTIDLTAIADGVFEGFERIDLTGGGNTLILAVSDIYAITEDQNALTLTGNTLVVDGNAADAVDAGSGWVFVDNAVDIGGTFFTQYTQDAATLYVDNAVDQSAIGLVSPQVDLADIAGGTGGFKIVGEGSSDDAGYSVSMAGDVNGDGFEDVIVGASSNSEGGTDAGAAYVVFGVASGFTAVNLDIIALGTGGFKITAEASADAAGFSVSEAGDVNGDGFDDLIVGAYGNGANGAAYVVFGAASGITAINLDDIASGTAGFLGFKITGEVAGDYAGHSVSAAGDVNGDGIDDLIVGAYGNDAGGFPAAGAAYVVLGAASGLTAVNLGTIAMGTGGFRITGEVLSDEAGKSVSSAGDVNGDGFDDVFIGAPDNASITGAGYVVFGAASGITAVDLVDIANGTGGFKMTGEAAPDFAGRSVSSAGDVNGDGFDDLIIGAYRNDAGGLQAGAAYVVFGAASGLTAVNLADIADGTGGFKIIGEAAGDYAGFSVSAAGDVNGDGFDDLIVGAYHNDNTGQLDGGAAYVVFGAASGLTTIDLDNVALGIGGFKINSETAEEYAGFAVSAAGDVDGDGFDDLIVGAPLNDAGGGGAGAAYVIFGRDYTNQVDFLGTTGNDSLTGTVAGEILIGGQGDDTIDGAGGDDVIIGGSGNDTIIYDPATDTLKVDGGTGTDILSVAGSGVTIDLTAINDGVFEGFERIDLTGGGNTLILAVSDLYAITEDQNALTLTGNTLIVDGNAGDAVDAGGGWLFADADVTIGSDSFAKFTQGTATLYVDNDVDQSAIGIVVPAISLGTVAAGTGGFKIVGENTGDFAGISVSSAGDVNGDGFDDLIVGATGVDGDGYDYGAAYVVYGAASGITAVDLVDVKNGTGGFKIRAEFPGDYAGYSVSSAGDVDGDGIDDLIVGAINEDAGGANSGAAYVVYGAAGGFTAVDLFDIKNGTGGFKITGQAAESETGNSVSSAGDVNGDGFDDLIIGAHFDDVAGTNAGAAYVVFGADGGFTSVNLVNVAAGTGGFKLTGEVGEDEAGFSVSSAGDFNGDGFDDLIVGAFLNDGPGVNAGAAYVVFGAASGLSSLDLSVIAGGTGGFQITAEAAQDRLGVSVSSAGDVNGDGFDDIVVGAYRSNTGGYNAGAAYVVYGSGTPPTAVSLSTVAAGTGGFKIIGEKTGDDAAISVSSAGDVNGDGFDDVLIGAHRNDANGYASGAAYVVFGTASGLTSVELDIIAAGTGGFKIIAEASQDQAGRSVSAAGDVDGDGFDDILVGARLNDTVNPDGGAAYVVFGEDFTNLVDFLGTAGNDVLTGTGANEILIGGQGDDTIDGAGGDDVIIGGSGNDTIIYDSATDTLKVDGGGGTDILSVAGSGVTIDLTAVGDGVFEGFERIDLTGGGNTLILAVSDIYAITEDRNALTATGATLIVDGDAGDAVDAGGGWVFVDNAVDIGGTFFTQYTQDAATLYVDNAVDQSAIGLVSPQVDLADVANATGGFKISGLTGDLAGKAVASVGDINGDGFDDVLVGAPDNDVVAFNAGAAYVVFGAASGITAVDLNVVAAGTGGFRILGEASIDRAGYAVAAAGDVNGDGIDDIFVGSQNGGAYVVFGASTPPTAVDLADVAAGTGGFKIVGETTNDNAGDSVASAGDVNGDGIDDLLIAANGNGTAGAAYVVFGVAGGLTAVDLADIAGGTGGFKIIGEASVDQAGSWVASAGDMNGDGFADVIVGAYGNDFSGDPNAGAAYVVFGAATPPTSINLADVANGTGGFKLIGEATDDLAGYSVASAGDINGDGFADVIVSAPFNNNAGGTDAGAAYVLFGAASGLTSIDLGAVAAGTGGFKIIGQAAGDYAGFSVTGAGDVNGDGFDDVIVGAYHNDGTGLLDGGAAYVVFGAASGLTTIDLDDVALGIGGFRINAEIADDHAGYAVSAAGDVDVDGFDDLIVGAPLNDGGGAGAGAGYVIFGRDFTNQVDFLGTAGNDSLTGTGANEILIGGQGDDTIDGAGGDDVIIGGSGNDTIVFDAADTLKVDAGTGTDILSVVGSGVIVDLMAIDDGVFEGFERIDLTGSGNNTLVMKVTDLYAITEGLNADTGSATTLIVDGIAGDVVDAASGWTLENSAVVIGPNTYTEYSQGAATLLVDNDVTQAVGLDLGWTNGTLDGSWQTAGNWNLGVVPPDNSDVTITDQTDTVTYSGTTVLNDLDLVDETLRITSGTLTVEGEFTEGASATLILDGGTLNVSPSTLTANGTITFSGGTIAGGTIQTSGTTTLDFENNQFNILDGVTLNGDVDLSVTGARFRVQNGFTLNTEGGGAPGSLTLSGQNSAIGFTGTQTFDDATVLFDASTTGSKILSADAAGTVLTLGPNLTISGGLGFIQQAEFVGGATTIVNQGTISADDAGGTGITIRPSTFSNENAIEAINGGFVTITAASWTNEAGATITATSSTLTFEDDWNNLGTVTVTSSTLNLDGTFTTADIGTLVRSGGTVALKGVLDNTSDTLTFNTASGSWDVSNATITGGTIQFGDGEGLNFLNSGSNFLDGVTINGAVDLSASAARFRVLNGLTLNTEIGGSPGSLTLSGSSSIIAFQGTQLFDNATVTFDAVSSGSKFLAADVAGTVLTLGSGVTISGGRGIITSGVFVGGAATIVNQGTISADANAELITIRPSTFDNENVVEATGGGSLSITSATSFINDGSVTISGGGTLTITASSWTNLATKTITATSSSLTLGGDWDNDGTITFNDVTDTKTLTLGGTFATADIGTLTRSGGTVTLTGTIDNGSDTLIFNTASGSWNVSGGRINNGTVQFGDGEGLNFLNSGSNFLDGVTINGAVDLSASAARFRVLNGLTLNAEGGGSPGSLTLSGSSSIIAFQGTQLFDNATVTFDAVSSGSKFLSADTAGTVLTLGSGVTISGGRGIITSGVFVGGAATIVNQGTISADANAELITIRPSTFDNENVVEATGGGSLSITSATSFINDGSVTISGGGTLTITASSWTNLATKTITATSSSLTLGGDWDNDGTITVTDSTVVLGGTFSTADIGTLTRSGGTVTLTGALDNSAAPPLTFNTASGSWNVNSATITGGIIQFGNGEGLNFQFNNSNFLDGVTINGAVDLSASAARFRVLNGLTLNTEIGGSPGSLTLSGSSSIIAFQGTQLFDNATVTFDAVSSGSKFLAADVAGTVLTLGSGVTISGGRRIITSGVFVGGAATIISLAAISANVSAETITISPKTFDNQGTINLANGGTVTMTVNGADYTSSGTINVLGGGDLTINFSGTTPTFTNESGGVINIDDPAGSQLILNGDAADTFINAAGAEINGSAGIINNGVTFTNAGTLNPGLSPGVMTIEGDLYQGDSAVLNIELAGTTPGSGHDQLVVTGEIQWNGTINVTLIDGFEPQAGDSFAIVNAASTTGDLDHLHGLRIGDDMVLGTDFSDTGLTLITLQASVENTGGGGNDTLGGGLGDDVIVGNDGDDIIVGGGGADHLYGDAGDDLLVVVGTDFARVDGGQGNDTLAFDGDLDLRLIRGDQIEGIEEIDFSGTGNNLLVLDAENVRAITDGLNTKPDNAALHAKNSLVVTGNAGDTVDLDQFTDTGVDTAVGGRAGYSVYQNADASAQVLVANEVTVVSAPPVA